MKAIRIIGMLTLTGALFFLAAAHVGAAQALRHASGGGFFVLQSGSGEFNDMMFSFTARLMDEQGNAKGQFEQHNLSIGGIVHLEIVYMEFENNNVWLIGEVTKSINTNANIGELRAVRLQDNGEGRNEALDMRSKLYKGPYTFPLPDYPLMVLDGGNIQIR